MKIFLSFLLLIIAAAASAQPVVLKNNSKEAADLRRKFEKEYPGEGPVVETPFTLAHQFQNACLSVVNDPKFENVVVHAVALTNEKGKVDYLLVSVAYAYQPDPKIKPNEERLDSLSTLLVTGLKPFAEQMVFRRTIGKKASTRIFSGLTRREQKPVAPRDSTVNTIEGLTAATDTARIKYIALGKSMLTKIPESIYRFPNAEVLLLADNDIDEVNLDLSRLPKLRQIDLTGNFVSEERMHFTKNRTLKMLTLQKNHLRDIPPAVKNCKGLETLWLGSNDMSKMSNKGFKRAKRIKDLNLYKAELTVLPKGIKKLKKLQVLDLYYNKLEALPATITKLRNLTHLAIAHNQISSLPARIDKLSKVHTLYAHHNHLSKLPEGISKMKNIKLLDLGYNWFTQFPQQLTSFVNLQELDLSSNNFPEFPEQLLKIQKLEKLYLRGNPFINSDAETKYNQQLTALKNRNVEVFY